MHEGVARDGVRRAGSQSRIQYEYDTVPQLSQPGDRLALSADGLCNPLQHENGLRDR